MNNIINLNSHIIFYSFYPIKFIRSYGVSAGKRDQIEIFFKKKFLSKIDVDLIIWSRTFVISKKIFLSIWSLFPALTPYVQLSNCSIGHCWIWTLSKLFNWTIGHMFKSNWTIGYYL